MPSAERKRWGLQLNTSPFDGMDHGGCNGGQGSEWYWQWHFLLGPAFISSGCYCSQTNSSNTISIIWICLRTMDVVLATVFLGELVVDISHFKLGWCDSERDEAIYVSGSFQTQPPALQDYWFKFWFLPPGVSWNRTSTDTLSVG